MAGDDHELHLAFPRLDEAELGILAGMADLCTFRDGEAPFRAGDRGLPLYVVESGEIAIVDESGDQPRTVVVHGPREFTGDVSLLTGGRGRRPSSCSSVPSNGTSPAVPAPAPWGRGASGRSVAPRVDRVMEHPVEGRQVGSLPAGDMILTLVIGEPCTNRPVAVAPRRGLWASRPPVRNV
ncbi:MAG: cyclic nucleotide-regulated FAD-dependent pyridine nucleotide-disulfide oxidoreductase [Planctomycetota bacterium]|nr:cyclic nucleotide-regulated FAD-dependent pyridine nucleotide-disulfide oxidoreductase [Planctomycetota bacterium]